MTDFYISSEGWLAVAQWAPSTAYTSGEYVRQALPLIYPGWSGFGGGSTDSITANFGGSSFTGTPPSGFSAWDASCVWDATHMGPDITLSGANLVASNINTSTWNTVLGTVGKSTGKKYLEYTIGTLSSSSDQIVGFAQQSMTLTTYLGNYGSDIMFGHQANGTLVNISSGWGPGGFIATNLMCICLDIDKGVYWFRIGATGNWNNDVNANPATGQGGMGLSGFFTGLGFGNERVFKCTTAGTSGSTQPSWNLGNNSTTTDNTAGWTQISGQAAEQAAGDWKAPMANLLAWQNLGPSTNRLFVSSDHNEIAQVNQSLNYGNSPELIVVSRTGVSLPPTTTDEANGAFINTGGTQNVSISGIWIKGLGLRSGCCNGFGSVSLGNNGTDTTFENGTLFVEGNGGGSINVGQGSTSGRMRITNPLLIGAPSGSQFFSINGTGITTLLEGVTSASFVGFNPVFNQDAQPSRFRAVGCDFTSATRVISTGTSQSVVATDRIDFVKCKFPTGESFNSATNQFYLDYRFYDCENGGNTTCQFAQRSGSGAIISRTDICRVTGAFDGNDNYGWQFQKDGNSTCSFLEPHRGAEFGNYYTGVTGSKTASVFLCSTVALTNAGFWIDLETLEDSGDTLGSIHTTRASTSLDAGTTLTTDTSDWTQGASARANSHAYTVGNPIKLASNTGRLFICTTAGTSASSEPGGYATAIDGGTVTDGSAVFTAVFRYVVGISFTVGRQGYVQAKPSFAPTGAVSTTFVYVDPALVIA